MHSSVKNALLFLFLTLGLIFKSAFAFDQTQLEMMKNMKIDKSQIESALKQLEAQGMVSNEEAEKARKQLSGMNDSDISKIKEQAVQKVKTGDIPKEVKQLQQNVPSLEERAPSSFRFEDFKK